MYVKSPLVYSGSDCLLHYVCRGKNYPGAVLIQRKLQYHYGCHFWLDSKQYQKPSFLAKLLSQVTVAIVESIRVILTFVCGVANANVIVTIALTFNFK